MFQDLTSLVLNIGTYSTKVGYGGDDAPKIITPSFVGKCQSQMIAQGLDDSSKFLVGEKYLSLNRSDLQIESIFKHHCQKQYEYDFQKFETLVTGLLQHQMNVNLSDYSVLISQDMVAKPHQLRQNRAKIAQIMFQKLKVANIYFCKNPVLSCFATGRSTALVLDSGQNYTRAISVHDGFALYKSAKILGIGGKTINQQIKQSIQKLIGQPLKCKSISSQHTHSYNHYHMNQLLRDIKQHLSVKPADETIQQIQKIQYQLPDHRIITIDKSDIIDPFVNISNYQKNIPIQILTIKDYQQWSLKILIFVMLILKNNFILIFL